MKTFQVPGFALWVIPLALIFVFGLIFAYYALFVDQMPADSRGVVLLFIAIILITLLGSLLFPTYQVNIYDNGDVELVSLLGKKRVPAGAFTSVTDLWGIWLSYQGGNAYIAASPLMFRAVLDLIYTIRSLNPQFRIRGILLPLIFRTTRFS